MKDLLKNIFITITLFLACPIATGMQQLAKAGHIMPSYIFNHIVFSIPHDPNHRDENKYTPLMLAALFGELELAIELIEAGAHPDFQNCDGQTARGLALNKACALRGFQQYRPTMIKCRKIVQLIDRRRGELRYEDTPYKKTSY